MINIHGVRGSVPNSSQHTLRYGGNTPCVEVKTAKYQLIFDCGSGFSKIDFTNDLQTILFISHFHHDHIQGLAFNNYEQLTTKKIIITSAHSNKTDTFNSLSNYYSHPYFPINFIELNKSFDFLEFDDVVAQFKNLKIRSINLNHPGKCSGYSLVEGNKKFCYLLDNEYEDSQKLELIKFCNNSDTIIWDGMFLNEELPYKKGWGHSSIEQGIDFANQIKVKNFLISHHAPSREDDEIDKMQNQFSSNNLKFASENEVIEF
tara:strand:+ start:216 stop:998 length:783 start_codon:yes stop_codon:yes gene_type:complete